MTSKAGTPRIVELAATISTSVAKIQELLNAQDIPSPSFHQDANHEIPKEATQDVDVVLDAASELYDLLLDPVSLLFQHGGHNNMICFQAISRFNIANIVPYGDQISYSDIADVIGLNEQITKRILRHAITMRIFCEPQPGMVAHTKASKLLTVRHMGDFMRTASDEMWPAASKTVDALEKWPDSQEPNETAFALANKTTGSIYDIIGADPARGARFAGAMKAYSTSPGFSVSHVLDNYDWTALGSGQVVDIGGARGHVTMALAEALPDLNFIVQDMDLIVEGAECGVPEKLKGRVKFMGHDFFKPQTVSADLYYFRWILHNWSDKYCVLILKALASALKPGARVLIQDTCMPEPGTIPSWREKDLRAADLNMQSIFNARERTVNEWHTLLAVADPRFELKNVVQPHGSALALFDIRWKESAL